MADPEEVADDEGADDEECTAWGDTWDGEAALNDYDK